MLHYRTFRNTDPPVLAQLWRSRAGQPGLMDPVSPDLFEQLVFGKLYFDPAGLVLAFDDDRPVGFAHAGFGPNEQQSDLSTDSGITCLVLVRPDCETSAVASGLLDRTEAYLRGRGARVLYGGGLRPKCPFYFGLYGGSELPGVLEVDEVAQRLFPSRGYREVERTCIFQRRLDDFVAPIDRRQMQIRRQMVVEMTEPPPATWWEACTIGDFDLTRFAVVPRSGGPPMATATFRTMQPVGAAAMGRATGLIHFRVEESMRHRGMAIFLMSEAFRQFLRQGIVFVEAQCLQSNPAARGFYGKLGFHPAGYGSVFRKEAGGGRRKDEG